MSYNPVLQYCLDKGCSSIRNIELPSLHSDFYLWDIHRHFMLYHYSFTLIYIYIYILAEVPGVARVQGKYGQKSLKLWKAFLIGVIYI